MSATSATIVSVRFTGGWGAILLFCLDRCQSIQKEQQCTWNLNVTEKLADSQHNAYRLASYCIMEFLGCPTTLCRSPTPAAQDKPFYEGWYCVKSRHDPHFFSATVTGGVGLSGRSYLDSGSDIWFMLIDVESGSNPWASFSHRSAISSSTQSNP